MQPKRFSAITLELFWWFFTFGLIALVLFPVYYYFPAYSLGVGNAFAIFIAITLTRFIFFLKYTFFGKMQQLKIALFFLMMPVIFILKNQLFSFMGYVHDGGLLTELSSLEYTKQYFLVRYIRSEYSFFLFASLFSAIIFTFRLLQSVWLLKNRGRVWSSNLNFMQKKYQSLKEFFPFYLSQHENTTCRILHFIGTFLVLLLFVFILWTAQYKLFWSLPIAGYGFAWVGHFFFEKNKPATFQYPLYSLTSDFIMFFQLLTGKISFYPSSTKER